MSRKRKATLHDVAGLAGVSTTTASYILNDRSAEMRISAETERRVREAVRRLGYRPNRSARNLRTATTRTIGVISDAVAGGHDANHLLTGAGVAARESDHLLLIGESEGDRDTETRLIEEMLDRQVDGLIYATLATLEVVAPPLLPPRASVLLNCVDPRSELTAVLPDEYQGGRTAAGLLLDVVRRGEVHVVGEEPTPTALAGALRLEGVASRLASVGCAPAGVLRCPWSVPAAYAVVSGWLESGGRAAGLVCLNDRVAMGTYQALAEHGLRVGVDVSVVSFDGSALAAWMRPSLTSISLPFAELGRLAVQTLLTPGPHPPVLRVPMPVLAGESVAGSGRETATPV